jgi:alpha-glucosidase (family GH31 glycosyl hydrolase)
MTQIPDHFRIEFASLAAPDAVIQAQNARFTVLTPRLIRLEYSPEERFEDRPSQAFWFRDLPVPPFTAKTTAAGRVEIETEFLALSYDVTDQGFAPESLSITLKATGVAWHFGDQDDRNLRGTYRTLDVADGAVPLEPGLMSRSGWAVVDDSKTLVFDDQCWLAARDTAPGALDLYFFGYGDDYQGCLRDTFRITGGVPMIPRWVLGNWWSRYHAYTQDELTGLMREFKAHGIPLSVCIIDMDWHITRTGNESSGWTGYTWNRDLIPDPPGLIAFLHDQGLRTALNLHPHAGVYPHEEQYPDMARRLGIDPASQQPVRFDIADRDYALAYFEILHHPYERMGVDFWWIDWQQGEASSLSGLDPLWWLNHLHFYDLGRDGARRRFIFSRWGGLGNHRTPIGFSGDTIVTWASLAFQPYFTATAANVGYGWWSHDIGGHGSGAEDAELYTRWVQYGVFSPIMRLHSTAGLFYDRRPFGPANRRTLDVTREAMRLRHALIPYLYTMAWRFVTDDLPPVRPMYYDHPGEEAAYHCPQQYAFGDLIAAPFASPQDPDTRLSRAVVWLPEGDWYHFFTGEACAGNQWRAIYGAIEDIPVFARAGAIVPLGPTVDWGGVENPAELDLHVFAGANDHFELYEDDGVSESYRRGDFCVTAFEQRWRENRLEFAMLPARGETRFIPAARTVRLHLYGVRTPDEVSAQIDGAALPCATAYDPAREVLTFEALEVPVTAELRVSVAMRTGSLLARRDRTSDTLFEMLRAFNLHTFTKQDLGSQIDLWRSDPSLLAQHRLALAPSQLQALAEVAYGAGVTRAPATGAPDQVVIWNNGENPAITYRYGTVEPVHHWSRVSTQDTGVAPAFRSIVPPTRVLPINLAGERAERARWQVEIDYFGLFDVTCG